METERSDLDQHPAYPVKGRAEILTLGLLLAMPVFAYALFGVYWTVAPFLIRRRRATAILKQAARHDDADAMNKVGWRYAGVLARRNRIAKRSDGLRFRLQRVL